MAESVMVLTPLRQVRKDALPEDMVYADRGCRYHPSCLTCPFDPCLFERRHLPNGATAFESPEREPLREEVRRRTAAGQTVEAIAVAMHLSERTVYRLRARIRAQ